MRGEHVATARRMRDRSWGGGGMNGKYRGVPPREDTDQSATGHLGVG